MKFLTFILLMATSSSYAAEYGIFCGEGREKGSKKAEIALVDDSESSMKLFFQGKEFPEAQFEVQPADDMYVVTLYKKDDSLDKKFEFYDARKEVQEFKIDEKGPDKKVGKAKPCNWIREEEEDEES